MFVLKHTLQWQFETCYGDSKRTVEALQTILLARWLKVSSCNVTDMRAESAE